MPVKVAVYLHGTDLDSTKFIQADVAPFGVLHIAIEDGKVEEDALLRIILGQVPVAAAQEEMHDNGFIGKGHVLG